MVYPQLSFHAEFKPGALSIQMRFAQLAWSRAGEPRLWERYLKISPPELTSHREPALYLTTKSSVGFMFSFRPLWYIVLLLLPQ